MNFSEDQARLITRIYKDFTCPVCKLKFSSNHQLCQHIYNRHKKEDAWANKYRDIRNNYNKDFITCPYCNDRLKDLGKHLFIKHRINTTDFRLKNPLIPLKVVKVKHGNYVCHICNKHYTRKNNLSNHYRLNHPEYYDKIRFVRTSVHYTCPICHNKFNDIRQHVACKHNMTWRYFCDSYNWNIKDSKYITDEYRKHLSENKRNFYKSESGILWRKQQSINFSNNNPSKLPHIRNKISQTAIKNINVNKFFNNSWGIRVWDKDITKGKFVRSFEEFKILYTLYINGISYEYEPESFTYRVRNKVKNYLPDLKIGNMYYEIKSSIKHISDEVLYKCSAIDRNVKIVTSKELFYELNISCDTEILYKYCRERLDSDAMKISYRTYKPTSRILEKICADFRNHKNINFRQMGVQYEIC